MGIVINETGIIYNEEDTLERNMKEQEYLEYIKDHINRVQVAFNMYIAPLREKNNISSMFSDEEIKNTIDRVEENIKRHDDSKFSDDEFDGYRAKYYPTNLEKSLGSEYDEMLQRRYDECWKSHYTNNPHHPEHWVNHETGVRNDMSLEAIMEMLCDWEAMSAKFNTNTLEWYENSAKDEKAAFSDNTKRIVEEFLYNILHTS